MRNAISWFEIAVTDMGRAVKFYSEMLDCEIQRMDMDDMKYAMFPYDEKGGGVGGGLVEMKGFKPSLEGPTLYLNGGDNLSIPLARVEAAGGEIMTPKTDIGENGFMAVFKDTEGNRIALHSFE